jgi:hypothetical protein
MVNFKRAWNKPTVYNQVHESVFRSWHILEVVKEMLETERFSSCHILEWIEVMEAVNLKGEVPDGAVEYEYYAEAHKLEKVK